MSDTKDRGHLLTEQNNPDSSNLDQLSTLEMVDVFNREDQKTVDAIAHARTHLAQAINLAAASMREGGRLFYVGAGTSGRLGVLDAAECPPTFCTPPELVQGIIAGGAAALLRSSEALEDEEESGAKALIDHRVTKRDVVVGITAGGTTPYVQGALKAARQCGASTIFMACVPAEQVSIEADVDIRLIVGPEVLAGSTRLKAGTVTKLALNILSTGVMVKLGKVYGNRMVDVAVTNSKLRDRAIRILCDLTELDRDQASNLLDRSDLQVKVALVMHLASVEKEKATAVLAAADGDLRTALEQAGN
ncbi:glucokinase regulator family protein [Synechococcus sp. PCC 7335]|uniref:N-acetylmuramic acid 6-phosphate etherase n=1 Tax=Synechococcus sp. (strain ATCC 29403 / PCC 7335) TaxID=91464 RepID=UPI00017EC799|nr:N-acetylmuramic acid 6-phosphate etherase [Synechococcus sp. PCC 7335]EDX85349.1 glucokinase regulator family protein [Synechococcus sp. PCC 7335]